MCIEIYIHDVLMRSSVRMAFTSRTVTFSQKTFFIIVPRGCRIRVVRRKSDRSEHSQYYIIVEFLSPVSDAASILRRARTSLVPFSGIHRYSRQLLASKCNTLNPDLEFGNLENQRIKSTTNWCTRVSSPNPVHGFHRNTNLTR